MNVVIRQVTNVTPDAELDAMIDRFAQVKPALDQLKREYEDLKEDLTPYFEMGVGQEITSSSGVTLRMACRDMLNQEKFLARVGVKLFNSMSKRVAVAALYKAAVIKGKIRQSDVDACMEPTEPWFKIV